jgi:hypothetical protein
MIKKVLLALAAILVVIQFIRPEKNSSDIRTNEMSTKYPMSPEVAATLQVACYDCHVAWWLNHHVEEGKHEINFSDFTSKRMAYQNHKFEEIAEQLEKKEMPLPSYTNFGLHPQANLSDAQRQMLISWAKVQMDSIKAHYPADSLVLRRRG